MSDRPRKENVTMRTIHFLWPVLFVLSLGGCRETSQGLAEKQYDVKGKVVAVDREQKIVTRDHEDIPGLMKAMKMKFQVPDAQVLEGLQPGDEVHGKLKVKSGQHLITELHKR